MAHGGASGVVTDRQAEGARERILGTAYGLFSTRGIRDVGIDEVIERAGVAKATLYRHFPSKDDLVLEFLRRRASLAGTDWMEREVRARGTTPEEQLVAIFDVYDEWFHQRDYEGCPFIRVMLEMGTTHPLGQASAAHQEDLQALAQQLAEDAGLSDPAGVASSWHLLMRGACVQAVAGDLDAAKRASLLGKMLIDEDRRNGPRVRSASRAERQATTKVTKPGARRA
jgi:AcrR family transcriptional regulator